MAFRDAAATNFIEFLWVVTAESVVPAGEWSFLSAERVGASIWKDVRHLKKVQAAHDSAEQAENTQDHQVATA